MGAKFRRRVVAGQNNKSFKDLRTDIRRLNERMDQLVTGFNGALGAVIKATGSEDKVREILGITEQQIDEAATPPVASEGTTNEEVHD